MSFYETYDYNLRFFFFFATGPDHHGFKGTTKIVDKETYYLSNEIEKTLVLETNKTVVNFVRMYDES